jgi:Flp pilus assembly protein TadD
MKGRLMIVLAMVGLFAGLAFADATPPPASKPSPAPAAAPKAPSASDLYSAGYTASKAGHYEEAIADFRSAIALNPSYAEAYNMLGFSLRQSGNIDEAFKDYATALKLKPDFPEAREYYGEAFLMAGDLKDAVRQYLVLQKAAKPQAKELLAKIDEYLIAHPGA